MINFLVNFLVAVLFLILFIWIYSFFFGAPFQPSSNKATKKILELSNIKRGQRTVDLGSGDGKIVIEFAKKGAEAHGFEINPFLVWLSRMRIRKLKLENKAFIHQKNFMEQDFSKFDIVTSYQIFYMMPALEKKLQKELKKGAKVISNTWRFPHWKPKKILGDVYLYER